MAANQPNVFLIGNHGPWVTHLRLAGFNKLPWDHNEVSDIRKAHVCFWWAAESTLTPATGVQVGQAIGLGIPIKIGSTSRSMTNLIGKAFGWTFLGDNKLTVQVEAPEVLNVYQVIMADIDVRPPTAFRSVVAREKGICKRCEGEVRPGDFVYSAFAGVYHEDCYKAAFDRENISEVFFNMTLVESLRKENAELQKKLRDADLHK